MEFNDIKDILKLEYIGPISSAILVLYGVWRKVIRPLSIVIKEDISERIKRQDNQDKMMTDVAWIIDQMKPNGGSSIKDSLNRLETDINLISQRQRIFMLDSTNGIFESDINGDCIYVNRTFCKWVGKSHNELQDRGWINVLHDSTKQKVVEEWSYAVKDGREFDLIYNLKDEDGNPIKVHCVATPMHDRNKHISGWSGILNKL